MTLMRRIAPAILAPFVCASFSLAEPRTTAREHVVRRGQTLYSIARSYGVPLDQLASINGIRNPARILAGTRLVVPVGIDPSVLRGEGGEEPGPSLVWPADGRVASRYGTPRRRHRHQGLDIGAPRGTPIRAVADGVVLTAEEKRGDYGRLVTVEHENGFVSLYGHNMKNLVKPGQQVSAGEVIALVGRTGNARGSHLHFELRLGGVPVDPLLVLSPPSAAIAHHPDPPAAAPSAHR